MYISHSSTYCESTVKAVLVKHGKGKQFHFIAGNLLCSGLNKWNLVYSIFLGLSE